MPMRKLRYGVSLLQRVEPLVKAGMLEKPVWYDAVKQVSRWRKNKTLLPRRTVDEGVSLHIVFRSKMCGGRRKSPICI